MKKKILAVMATITSVSAYAEIKLKGISELKSQTDEAGNSLTEIVLNVIGAALAISLLFVIYAIASNHPKAKEYGISWVVALVIYLVARYAIFS